MNRACTAVVLAGLAITSVGVVEAQDAGSAPAAQASAANPANQIKGPMPVKLEKNIDSKKLKVGDTVVFQTVAPVHSGSGLMIPTGSKIFGHVTQAQARSKGDADSTLAIAFDKIEYSKGEDIPMKGNLQAIGPNLGGDSNSNSGMYGNVLSSKGGNGSSPPPTSSMQIGGPANGSAVLTGTSQGVHGVKGLEMSSDGVLTSPAKEVHLDAGMQILIHAEIDLPSR